MLNLVWVKLNVPVGVAGVPVAVDHQLLLGLDLLDVIGDAVADRELLLIRLLGEELSKLHDDECNGERDGSHGGGGHGDDGWKRKTKWNVNLSPGRAEKKPMFKQNNISTSTMTNKRSENIMNGNLKIFGHNNMPASRNNFPYLAIDG